MTGESEEQVTISRSANTAQVLTFLIADIRGYTRFTQERGDEAAAALSTTFASIVRGVVNDAGGHMVEQRGDEALCVFESARQALRAAIDLQQYFARHSLENTELPMPVGIGLDAGEAVPVAGGYRGGALNLAARLCSLAGPGEVLANQAVTHLAGRIDGLNYVERGGMEFKGIAAPVPVISIESSVRDSEHAGDTQSSPGGVSTHSSEDMTHSPQLPIGSFLGSLPAGEMTDRQDELERIGGVLDRVADGVGQLLVLSGGQGMGKTRLAQEITRLVHNREFIIATGRCYEPQRSVAYYPFVEALTAAFEAASPAIRSTVARQWPQLGRLLPEQIAATPTPSPDPGEEQLRLFRSVAGFLAALARNRPVALMLDDIQWADDGSIALLQHLARTLRGSLILLLAAYRDSEPARSATVDRAFRDLTREGLLERIVVQRLSREDTAAMISSTIGDLEASEEFAEYVYHRTRGNPYFIDEMLRALGGRYRIVREIGAGGMGRVFEAVDTRSGKTVAAKLMFATSEVNFDALLRFQQEGAVLATLKHPNIVEVLGTFSEERASCIVMELLDGRSLGEIQRSDTLGLARIKTLMRQTAAALAYAHGKSIVHRDVKPDNIIVLSGDRVKVTDFGIARILRPDATVATMQSTGMTLGTPLYMAPEQIEGKRVDGRADLYSLGAVMYGLVAGRPPFEGTDPMTIAFRHVHEAPAPPSEVAADVPSDWEVLILRALAKDPADRFRSASEFEAAVAALSTEPNGRPKVDPSRGAVVPVSHLHSGKPAHSAHPRPPAPDRMGVPTPMPPPIPAIPKADTLDGLGDQISALVQGRVEHSLGQIKARLATDEEDRRVVRFAQEEASQAHEMHRSLAIPTLGSRGMLQRQRDGRPVATRFVLILAGATIVVAAIVVALLLHSHGSASAHYAFGKPDTAFGRPPPSPPPFAAPAGLALDSAGNLYVADSVRGTVRELSPSGNPVALWPVPGSRFTLGTPTSVGIDAAGNIYVADSQNDRVVELSPSGAPVRSWSPQPGGDLNNGETPSVSSLAVDAAGNVFLANSAAAHIESYTATGKFIGKWSFPYSFYTGTLYGTPDLPSVAVDRTGHVYVSDLASRRVLVYTPRGKLLHSLGTPGFGPGQFLLISSLACDARGHLYVADHWATSAGVVSGRIQEFSPDGKLLSTWGNLLTPPDKYGLIPDIAIDNSGSLYLSSPNDETVRKVSHTDNLLDSWNGTLRRSSFQVHHPYGITVDTHGRVLASELRQRRIDVLSAGGQFLTTWNRFGHTPFQAPTNMATDAHGNIYVADTSANRIYELTSDGRPVRAFGATGQLSAPYSVAIGTDASLYIADSGKNRVVRFSPQGKQEAAWTSPITAQGLSGIAVDTDGSVYVSLQSYLYKLSKDLSLIGRWGSNGSGSGQFNGVSGIAADGHGHIVVADSNNNRIQVFSSDGTFLAQFGRAGSGTGQFNNPNSVAVDSRGDVYVADTGNNRVQKFFAGG